MKHSAPELRKIDDEIFPYEKDTEAQLSFLLRYATLAPSHYNIQPWRFQIEDGGLNLYLDASRIAKIVDPDSREVTISCGAAITMLEVASRHFGFNSEVSYPDELREGFVARFQLTQKTEPTSLDNLLFNAIKRRQTNRRWFDNSPVPQKIVQRCLNHTRELNAEVVFIDDRDMRTRFATLIEIAVKLQFSQPWYRQELSTWLRPSYRVGTDGMPSFGLFSNRKVTPLAGTLLKYFYSGKQIAQLNKQKIIEGSPTLCILSTKEEHFTSWLDTGRALSAVLLNISIAGLSASYMNQAIQMPTLRRQVADIFATARYPQLVLRVGYANSVTWTPRREVQDCLV